MTNKCKKRKICQDCGIPLGRKNTDLLCFACRKIRGENPKIRFGASVKVVTLNGRKVLVG